MSRRSATAVLAIVVAAGSAGPIGATAQDMPTPNPPPVVDVELLERLCAENASGDGQRAACLEVVHDVLVPGSGPDATPGASFDGYGSDLPGIGVVQSHPDVDVTLVDVDWDAAADSMFSEPQDGYQLVSLLVLYEGTRDGGSYNPYNWTVVDLDGFEYDRSAFGREPELSSSNDLPAGRKAQGWITFEVPEDVSALEVVESQADYLRWLIAR